LIERNARRIRARTANRIMMGDATMRPGVIVRRAQSADAQLLADLGSRTFDETFAESNRPEDLEAFLRATYGLAQQRAELADPRLRYFVGVLEGLPSGFAMLRDGTSDPSVTGSDPIELARIYVVRAASGCGIGSALMESVIAEARSLARRTLWLGVWEHNHRAQEFYQRWGFHAVGQHIFMVGSDPQIDLVMVRSLSS
jgi:ribosomal protein S18 acetylase RimI-like enzyme